MQGSNIFVQMKICPKCHSKYTDDSLKFCLQDGAVLSSSSEHKTENLDTDDIAHLETVAIDPPRTDPDTETREIESVSSETIERPRPRRTGGFSFLTGLITGAAILGVAVVAGLGFWLIPGYLEDQGNNNANVLPKQPEKVTNEMIEKITASSFRRPYNGILYIPENIHDADVRTAWSEGAAGPGRGEWIKITFTKPLELSQLSIKPGYFKNASIWKKNNRVASVRLQFSNGQNRIFDFPDEMKTQTIDLNGVITSFVKISMNEVYLGSSDIEDTLISEIGFTALN